MSMKEIERRTLALAETRERVAAIVSELNAGIEALQRANMPALRRAVAAAANKHDELKQVIEANPELFVKPRTVVLNGIKVGLAKGKGSIEFEDPEQVVKLIKRNHPDQVDVLIQTEEKPVKTALAQLSAAELKRLGVKVEGTDDVVVIKPTDSAVDKTVAALLKAAIDERAEVSS